MPDGTTEEKNDGEEAKTERADVKLAVARFLKAGFIRFWNRQFRETGTPPDQRDYAEWLGVAPPSLSRWMTQKGLPNDEQRRMIAKRLGVGIYKAAGSPVMLPDDPQVQEIVSYWYDLDGSEQEQVLELMRKLYDSGDNRTLLPDIEA